MKLDRAALQKLRKGNIFGEVMLPDCPKELKRVAEMLLTVVDTTSGPFVVNPSRYNTMTELDKFLTMLFWTYWDGLSTTVFNNGMESFTYWYTQVATSPDIITRARRYLVNTLHILEPKASVQENAEQAAENWRGSLGPGSSSER